MTKIEVALIVYQGGIANVFTVPGPISGLKAKDSTGQWQDRRRLAQSGFADCEWFARGLGAAGVRVYLASCNKAGDIAHLDWTPGLDDCPFREQAGFRPKT